jgi:catechol 2,3-dioxygenase-like lactoylglutathione lyase family enzyme
MESGVMPKTDVPKLSFIGVMHEGIPISLKNLDASIRFYIDVLGLHKIPRPKALDDIGPGAWLENEERTVQFHLIGTDEELKPGPDAKIAPAGRHTAWIIKDAEAFRGRMRALSIPFEEIGSLVGRPQLFIKDPEGHTWEFQTPPPAN